MMLFVNAISFLSIGLVAYPATVHGGTLRALSDEDPAKRSRPVAPSTYAWEIIGKDIDGEVGTQSGDGVSLNADGSRVAVGSVNGGGEFPELGEFGEGDVQVYERGANNKWVEVGNRIEGEKDGEKSGQSVSLSGSGNRVAVGAPYHDKTNGNSYFGQGQVRVYDYNHGDWVQYGQDLNGDNLYDYFGGKVRLSQDGSRLIVGVREGNDTGYARVFADIDETWVQIGQDLNGVGYGDDAGAGIAISANGERVALGAHRHDGSTGHTRIYELVDSAWAQVGQDIDGEDKDDWSGLDVDLNYDGTRVIVGDHYASTPGGARSGQARVFDEVDGTWVQVGGDIDGTIKYGYFGWSVGITDDGSRVAIAAYADSDSDLFTGAVRVFDIVNNEWVQNGPDIDGEDENNFTPRVALSADGSTVAVGSPDNEGEGPINVFDDFDDILNDDYWSFTIYGGHVRVFELVEQCTDSPLSFDYKTFGSINCGNVSDNPKACEDAIVASHCPDTCNSCEEHKCADSEAYVIYQGQKGTCDLLESIDPDQVSIMCSRNEVKKTCRETCDFC